MKQLLFKIAELEIWLCACMKTERLIKAYKFTGFEILKDFLYYQIWCVCTIPTDRVKSTNSKTRVKKNCNHKYG